MTNNRTEDGQLTLLANTLFWRRADRCRALDNLEQYVSLMLAGMNSGSPALAALDALCAAFPELAGTSTAAAANAVDALYRQARNTRTSLERACLKKVEPMLAKVDPEALRLVRQGAANRDSQWWM